jgi:hypothetical protein
MTDQERKALRGFLQRMEARRQTVERNHVNDFTNAFLRGQLCELEIALADFKETFAEDLAEGEE